MMDKWYNLLFYWKAHTYLNFLFLKLITITVLYFLPHLPTIGLETLLFFYFLFPKAPISKVQWTPQNL